MFKPGIVICSRLDSSRVPNKVLRRLNGVPLIRHLVNQLLPLKVPIIIAVPGAQTKEYDKTLGALFPDVEIWPSKYALDPLARMTEVADHFGFTHVVRITHDKIFVDTTILKNALTIAQYEDEGIEYIYSTYLTPGTGFEVIKRPLLERANAQHKEPVEHITYAVRPLSQLSVNLETPTHPVNLLIDYPEDLQLHEVLFASLGNQAKLVDVLQYLKKNPELIRINLPPVVTVYTCVYNGQEFIERAMNSVAYQADFKSKFEYIIVDDHSTDRTPELIAKFAVGKPNVRWFRNEENKGLASSSNVALQNARGNYIIRLDADDHFVGGCALVDMLNFARESRAEILYPDNYFGDLTRIQKGNEKHHIGGALFDKRALAYLRFKDGLRNHDSLEIFTRARSKLKIKYFESPTFVYTQRPDSMSKTNLDERERVRKEIEGTP